MQSMLLKDNVERVLSIVPFFSWRSVKKPSQLGSFCFFLLPKRKWKRSDQDL